jgi:energy-coupling factor transporter ATP-binding protein EcfA2
MARNLSDWLDSFMELTDNSEPPALFRKWAGISAIAAALQRKVRLELGLSLTFYPNLYIVLVGPSATGKGTAMKFASDIIEQVPTIRLSAQATSLQALIRRMKDTNLTDVNVETGEQTYHSSLTIFSTEFTVFLGYHNQELIAALCEWYDCHNRWTYETIARKKEEVVGVWVNLFAGTTPDAIQASLPIESIGGGLTSRIIFVVEEKRGKLVVVPTKTEREMQLQQKLVYDLEAINRLSGIMQYTEGFLKIYSDWCYYADGHRPFQDKKFDGYCGRRRKHLITLAMVCCASHSDEMIITSEDIDRAIELLAEVEIKMGKVFKGMGRSGTADLLNDAITFVANSAVADIPLFQFARYFEGDMDKIEMDRVITTLEAMNLIKVIKSPGVGITLHIIGFEK